MLNPIRTKRFYRRYSGQAALPERPRDTAAEVQLRYLISLDARKRHVDHVAPRVTSEGLDQRGFACPGGSVQQKPELVRIPLDGVLACELPGAVLPTQHENERGGRETGREAGRDGGRDGGREGGTEEETPR